MESEIHARNFPIYFPKGCPSSDATDKAIKLYRLCSNNPPCEEDFIPSFLEDPDRHSGEILAYGLSTLGSVSACIDALKKSPYLRKKYKYIAKGMTTPATGKYLLTSSTFCTEHNTWWVYDGIKPNTFFSVCAELGD